MLSFEAKEELLLDDQKGAVVETVAVSELLKKDTIMPKCPILLIIDSRMDVRLILLPKGRRTLQ